MSGHSKWANIKHRKGAADAKRGKVFTKLIKEIITAARIGGGDINANPRLRSAVMAAKVENMPKDNWERAIKKGTGELEGVNYEEATYEGYGPGGAAVFIESLSDNKNRAVAEIRHALNKHGGNMGENGCVAWMFESKGLFLIPTDRTTEDTLMEVAIEAGADDVLESGGDWVAATRAATGGRGADVIFDPVGGERFESSPRCLAPEGRLLVIGFAGGSIPSLAANRILLRNIDVVGVNWGGFLSIEPTLPAATHEALAAMVAAGRVAPIVGRSYPLESAAEALDDLDSRRARGKLVLAIGSD